MTAFPRSLTAILPVTDMAASTAFYRRLHLELFNDYGSYRILGDRKGCFLHLSTEAPAGWVVPGRNPNGLYMYIDDVDGLAAEVSDLLPGGGPTDKPWGMYEFSVSDPDGTLVRVGRPSVARD